MSSSPRALWLAGCITLCLCASARAQTCESYWTAAYKCLQGCGACPSNAPPEDFDPDHYYGVLHSTPHAILRHLFGADRTAPASSSSSPKDTASRAANDLNEQGLQAFNRGDLDAAKALFTQAIATASAGGVDPGPTLRGNLAATESDIVERRGYRAKLAAVGSRLDQLSGVLEDRSPAGAVSGLDFVSADPPPGSPASKCPLVVDSMVVDACNVEKWGKDLPKVDEIEASPAVEPARKGLQAVANHDWPAALLWWKAALRIDPDNGALLRSVDMAEWVLGERARTAAARRPISPVLDALDGGDLPKARTELASLKATRTDLREQADRMAVFLSSHESDYLGRLGLESGPAAAGAEKGGRANDPFKRAFSDELFDQSLLQDALGNRKSADYLLTQAMHAYRRESAIALSAAGAAGSKPRASDQTHDSIHN